MKIPILICQNKYGFIKVSSPSDSYMWGVFVFLLLHTFTLKAVDIDDDNLKEEEINDGV